MAQHVIRVTPEATWGVYNPATTPPNFLVDIDRDNPFDMRPKPVTKDVRTASGGNLRGTKVSAKTECKGNLNMLLRGSTAVLVAPWVSGGSCTIDEMIKMEDGASTKVYRRYLGVMVEEAEFDGDESGQLLELKLKLQGKAPATITITDFPEPAPSAYASDAFYLFENMAGAFTVGTSRTEFEKFNCKVGNKLDPRFMASQFLTRLKYCGRDVDFSTRFPFITQIDRTDFEALTPVAATATFTAGAHTLVFTFNSNNYFDDVKDNFSLDKVYLQEVMLQAFLDSTAGTDFTLVAT